MRDLEKLAAYIGADSEQNAQLVEARIHESARLLSLLPGAGRSGRVKSTRERVVLRMPYILVYRLQRRTIRILRVYHGSRRWPSHFN
jgi:plasmid stabilization system protein ParE